jgi:hypothetical protein
MTFDIVRSMRGILLLTLAAAGAGSAGCRMFTRGITESVLEREPSPQWHVHYGSRIHYTLTNDSLQDMEFEGTRDANEVVVRYQEGLARQAQGVAETTAGLLRQVEQRIGVTITTRTTAYLLRFDHKPQDFDVVLAVEPNEFPLPLFVGVGEESCETILAHNRGYPYLLVHELVETSLTGGGKGARVLPDLAWGLPGLKLHANNYTRWFRDGLANYAGYLAYDLFARELPSEQRLQIQTILHTEPFSSLARIGERLFSWPQSSATKAERYYYNAALGLFLLIADTFGEQAIRDITAEVATRRSVDGRDLIEICRRVLGLDVRQLARDFKFPDVDMEMERISPALALNKGVALREGLFVLNVPEDSRARRAGLRPKDVITAVGSTPVANHLDFELGLFQARRQPGVSLTVQRIGAGTLTLELPLKEPRTPDKAAPPGKRRDPLKKGRRELTPLLAAPVS